MNDISQEIHKIKTIIYSSWKWIVAISNSVGLKKILPMRYSSWNSLAGEALSHAVNKKLASKTT